MVLSFKDQGLEAEMRESSRAKGKSPSQIARGDLMRYQFLIDDHSPLKLETGEFLAVCSIVKSTQLFDEPSRIKRMPLLVEDCIRSCTNSAGEYTKTEQFDFDLDALLNKLREATSLQLFGLVDRCERYPQSDLDAQRFKHKRS
ncbi:MAG: hypothetical protein IPK73_21760 [Candidatus Obscuribacter sp.]|nr:hypothetical protein [Candidatus Obscuribacter sp.]MBK9276741.1 hypothetical protein [Candidatus Obscuribacter sp.]MBL8083520.1 hypothetical protein [Candidatus Obscuribacter sp.]